MSKKISEVVLGYNTKNKIGIKKQIAKYSNIQRISGKKKTMENLNKMGKLLEKQNIENWHMNN